MQLGNSCDVVKTVLNTQLIQFGAEIDFNFLTETRSLSLLNHEGFFVGLLVRDLLLDLLQICQHSSDCVHCLSSRLDVLECLLQQVLNHWVTDADLHP